MAETTTTAIPEREKLSKKAITADHPTWCPGCGDFAVLASFYKVLEKKNLDHEKIVTLAGIGCSSRFPYFVNGHGAHFIHGRAVPLASGIECLSECVEFFPDVFDPADPRKGGAFSLIEEKKWDNTPEDELRHDVTDELAAYKLAQLPFPGVFGVFYQNDRPTKNALEKKWIESSREKTGNASDLQLLQKTFDRMK